MFHAGETLLDSGGSKNPENSNLYDAVLLNAKRVGHGFSLLKHPVLIKQFRERPICIELCPTSNELLHLCRNIKEHPFPEILATGIPCTVNSDNPSLFRSVNMFSPRIPSHDSRTNLDTATPSRTNSIKSW
jgi:adenosine deaminase CECR1